MQSRTGFFHSKPHSKPSNRRYFSTNFRTPYPDKETFTKATDGAFHHVYNKDGKRIRTAVDVQNSAYHESYKLTSHSGSTAFAITYTGSDYNFLSIMDRFPLFGGNKVDYVAHGRLYNPTEHSWSENATWVMAQAHMGRSVALLSDASNPNSAFAKEIEAFRRCGYKMSKDVTFLNDSADHTIVYMNPDPVKSSTVELRDLLQITHEDCVKSIAKFQLEKRDLLQRAGKQPLPAISAISSAVHGAKESGGVMHKKVFGQFFGFFEQGIFNAAPNSQMEDGVQQNKPKKHAYN